MFCRCIGMGFLGATAAPSDPEELRSLGLVSERWS